MTQQEINSANSQIVRDTSIDDAKWLLGGVAAIFMLVFSTGCLAAILGA
ncbi:MAG: hypothetical protein AAF412_12200 [Pseudomonadota bacterium]